MPWDAKQFAAKHNKKLTGKAAGAAAKQATAMVKAGVPEGEAIATANKRGDKLEAKRTNGSSPRSADEHMAARKTQGLSHRAVASEFGTSKSTAHRKVTKALGQGFTQEGSAR
jgi:uncharacterized protein YdaT